MHLTIFELLLIKIVRRHCEMQKDNTFLSLSESWQNHNIKTVP